jgi:amino acid transporter
VDRGDEATDDQLRQLRLAYVGDDRLANPNGVALCSVFAIGRVMSRRQTPTKPGWYPHRYGDEGKESYWNGREWTGQTRQRRSRVSGWVWFAVGAVVGLAVTFFGFLGAAAGSYLGGMLFFMGLAILAVTLLGGFALQVDKERRERKINHSS